MPNYLIIGVQKGGTTSFYDHLVRHPKVTRAKKKEIYFFNHHYQKGADWYRGHFPTFDNGQANLVTGVAPRIILMIRWSCHGVENDAGYQTD